MWVSYIQTQKRNKKIHTSNLKKTGIILGYAILVILVFCVLKDNNQNIEGVWVYTETMPSGIIFKKKIQFIDDKNATLTNIAMGTYGNSYDRKFNCIYVFNNRNNKIKLTCDDDTEEIKNNIWVNFKFKGDYIYIDNDKYVRFVVK